MGYSRNITLFMWEHQYKQCDYNSKGKYVWLWRLRSGIGAAGGGTVGSISISNAIVYAEGGGTAKNGYYDLYGAAAIGGGFDGSGNEQTEFDITITNSTIHATKSCSYATYIGRKGELSDPANYDIISSARITDSTIYKYAYGPSGGDSPSSDGSVVYDANGNRTDQ